MKARYAYLIVLFVGSAMNLASPAGYAAQGGGMNSGSRLAEEVRHQLVLIPFLTIFDDLKYSVSGAQVTLSGWVTNGAVKDNAESAVKHVEGVTKVVDNIQLLPVSPMDDQIRRAEFRAIYGDPALEKYASGTLLPLQNIVNGGHVTLEGSVLSEADKDLANIRANGVANAFSVTNNLQVEPGR